MVCLLPHQLYQSMENVFLSKSPDKADCLSHQLWQRYVNLKTIIQSQRSIHPQLIRKIPESVEVIAIGGVQHIFNADVNTKFVFLQRDRSGRIKS